MSDLRTMMHSAAGPISDPPTADVARADRIRGDRALRRRRAAQWGGGSSLAAVAAVGVFAIVGAGSSVSNPTTPPGIASGSLAPSKLGGTALVSYTGKQPVGYVLDKVPAGWKVRINDASLLVLAPPGASPVPESGPVKKGVSEPIYVGLDTIKISTQSDMGMPSGVPLDRVTVDGRDAVIARLKGGDDGRTLVAEQPSGAYLEIGVPAGLGWNNDQIVEFAESVHITKDAEEVRG
jgi:hypothetical protein